MLQLKNSNNSFINKQIILIFTYFTIIFCSYYIININNLTNISYTLLFYILLLVILTKLKQLRLSIFIINFILGLKLFFNLKYGYISESLLKIALQNDKNQSIIMIINEFISIILPSMLFFLLHTDFIYNGIKISFKSNILYWIITTITCFFLFKNTVYYYLSDKRHIVDFNVDPFLL